MFNLANFARELRYFLFSGGSTHQLFLDEAAMTPAHWRIVEEAVRF